jgi:hypothetical protein
MRHKHIEPLYSMANAERISNPKRYKMQLKRNCIEVVMHESTAVETADFIQFVIQGSKT